MRLPAGDLDAPAARVQRNRRTRRRRVPVNDVRRLKSKPNGAWVCNKVGLDLPCLQEGIDDLPGFIFIPEVLAGLDPQFSAVNFKATESGVTHKGFRINVFRATLGGHRVEQKLDMWIAHL